jgi:hypothetical protein
MDDGTRSLIGSWSLRSFELRTSDGNTIHPYGEEVHGFLFYNEDGYMSAAFENSKRSTSRSDDLAEAGRATHYDQFMAYSGPFEVQGDRILHRVAVASMDAWTGTLQERWFKIDGDVLTLLTAPLNVGSDTPTGYLVWERVTGGTIEG